MNGPNDGRGIYLDNVNLQKIIPDITSSSYLKKSTELIL